MYSVSNTLSIYTYVLCSIFYGLHGGNCLLEVIFTFNLAIFTTYIVNLSKSQYRPCVSSDIGMYSLGVWN